jgi:hypothetical protein
MYEEAPDDIGGERCNNCRHAPLQSKNADDMRSCRKLLESSTNKFGSCHERRRKFEKKNHKQQPKKRKITHDFTTVGTILNARKKKQSWKEN